MAYFNISQNFFCDIEGRHKKCHKECWKEPQLLVNNVRLLYLLRETAFVSKARQRIVTRRNCNAFNRSYEVSCQTNDIQYMGTWKIATLCELQTLLIR
jgi:hypothetical protein